MAGVDTPFGSQYSAGGEINILEQLLGLLGPLLSSMDRSPDKFMLNQLTGSPFGGQQARFDGRSPRLHDIMVYEQQKTFFEVSNAAMQAQKQSMLTGIYSMAGFNQNADIRAQNAANNIYNPLGMAAGLAMLSYGETGAKRAYAQGFMGMGIHAPAINQSMLGAGVQSNKDLMSGAITRFTSDYFANPDAYGGFNLQGQGEVFQQMAQRSLLGKQDLGKDRIATTSKRVQDMSQAVGAMQELFGGTIPELFDKMDAIFGGNAGAMGGQALLGRVLRMKQTSAVTGQSLQALAQMHIVGGQYAQAAGMDAAIGAGAAEEASLINGINYADAGFSTRRVNAGRMRTAALQTSVAAATSRMAQYYAGAYATYLDRQGMDPAKMTAEQQAAASNAFAGLAAGATNIGELATAAGASVVDVRRMSMSNQAMEYMDSTHVRRFAMQGSSRNKQAAIAKAMQREVQRVLGRGVDEKVFFRNGSLRGTTDIISDLKTMGLNTAAAAGIIDNQMNQGGSALYGVNGQELEALLYAERNVGPLRALRDARQKADADLGITSGSALGIMNYLSSNKEGASAKFGDVVSAMLGVITPDEAKKRLGAAGIDDRGSASAVSLRKLYADAAGDPAQQSRIRTITQGMLSADRLGSLSGKQRAQLLDIMEGGITSGEVKDLWKMFRTQEQADAEQLLTDTGLAKDYNAALKGDSNVLTKQIGREAAIKGDSNVLTKQIGREAAIKGALKNVSNEALRKKISDKLFKDAGRDDDPTSMKDAKARLADMQMDPQQRAKLFADMERNMSAMGVADQKADLGNVLGRLVDVLEKFANMQPLKTKPK